MTARWIKCKAKVPSKAEGLHYFKFKKTDVHMYLGEKKKWKGFFLSVRPFVGERGKG